MVDAKKKLFKDKINKTNNIVLTKELMNAIEAGEDVLKELLLGTAEPELYSAHGSYKEGEHSRCGGMKKDAFTEKRLCKCLYYKNGKYHNPEECGECDFPHEYRYTRILKHFGKS